jgi:hypothetical protein
MSKEDESGDIGLVILVILVIALVSLPEQGNAPTFAVSSAHMHDVMVGYGG